MASSLSNAINYCRIINGSKGFNDTKTQLLSEMAQDYNEGREDSIYRFNVLINTIDAKDVQLNNETNLIRGVIDTRRKQTATSEMEQTIQVYPNLIKTGDYAKFKMNENDIVHNYIITSAIEKKNGYDEGVIIECNQTLKWKDKNNNIHEYPCVSKNDSYGSKLVLNNDMIQNISSKTKITVQYNEYTKTIGKDTRFIFSHSEEDIYKSADINRSINEGIITITCDKSELRNEDSLENNLAFNDYSSVVLPDIPIDTTNPNNPTVYSIIGEENIKVNTNKTYNINPIITDCIWSIDDESIATIVSQSNGSCIIKPLLVNEFFVLSCKNSLGNLLAEKTVNVLRW